MGSLYTTHFHGSPPLTGLHINPVRCKQANPLVNTIAYIAIGYIIIIHILIQICNCAANPDQFKPVELVIFCCKWLMYHRVGRLYK